VCRQRGRNARDRASSPEFKYRVGPQRLLGHELGGPFDAVVSSLALHHLETDADKRAFYRRIYEALAPDGVFYNADVVCGASEPLQDKYLDAWRAFMRRSVPDDEIEGTWLPRYYAEDRPAPLVDQLVWLSEIGFREIDVMWKYFNFSVYGGRR